MNKHLEDCWRCDKEFDYSKKNSMLITIHKGIVKKTKFANHEHIAYCPKCSQDIIAFIKTIKHKLPVSLD